MVRNPDVVTNRQTAATDHVVVSHDDIGAIDVGRPFSTRYSRRMKRSNMETWADLWIITSDKHTNLSSIFRSSNGRVLQRGSPDEQVDSCRGSLGAWERASCTITSTRRKEF